jgi:hypothetical protein
MPSRAPIVNNSSTLGRRQIGCEITAAEHARLSAEAKLRGTTVGTMMRQIATVLAQRPELIATVFGERRVTGGERP